MSKMKLESGFTLVELLVTTGIVAVLLGMAVAQYDKHRDKVKKINVLYLAREVATQFFDHHDFYSYDSGQFWSVGNIKRRGGRTFAESPSIDTKLVSTYPGFMNRQFDEDIVITINLFAPNSNAWTEAGTSMAIRVIDCTLENDEVSDGFKYETITAYDSNGLLLGSPGGLRIEDDVRGNFSPDFSATFCDS